MDLKKEVAELVASIGKDIVVAKDGGVTVAEGLYTKHLPEGVTVDVLKQAQEYTTNFVAAAGKVFGDSSIGAMTKNKDLARTIADIPLIGKDTLSFTFDRSKEVRAPGSEETSVKHGALAAKISTYGVGDRGTFAHVKKMLVTQATEAFGK